jgi:hypothetical protein
VRRALIRGQLALVSAVSAVTACGLSTVGLGPADADAGAQLPDAASTSGDASADVIATADARADGGGCVPSPGGLVGFWAGDGNMSDVTGMNQGAAGTQNGASGMAYAAGEVGQAFDLGAKSYVRVPTSASLNLTQAVSVEAWIFATALGGRIVDKNTAGGSDGYMLDTYQGKVRLIIGGVNLIPTMTLPVNQWTHVAGTWDGMTMRVYANAVLVGSAPAPKLPANNVDLRIGADSNGQNHFSGKLDEIAVYSRALSSGELTSIFVAGTHGRCR